LFFYFPATQKETSVTYKVLESLSIIKSNDTPVSTTSKRSTLKTFHAGFSRFQGKKGPQEKKCNHQTEESTK